MRELRKRGETLALVLADQRMPGMTGVELLESARDLFPKAKRALLTAYADTDAAIAAINLAQIDYYLQKPWDPPEERLFPTLEDLLGDWQADAVLSDPEARLVGHRFSPASHDARDFLARNRVPYEWLDVDRDQEARQLLDLAGISHERLPAVFLRNGTVLEAPTPLELASSLGLPTQAELDFYDLIIVGGGPAGLAAAVYGASEGLRTVLVERAAPGGQAGQSSRIENYLGFPNGLSGADLARRAHDQARRFGAELLSVQEVTGLEARGPQRVVTLAGGERARRPQRARGDRRRLPAARRARRRRARGPRRLLRRLDRRGGGLRATRPSRSWAARTPPARPRSTSRARPRGCSSSCAVRR